MTTLLIPLTGPDGAPIWVNVENLCAILTNPQDGKATLALAGGNLHTQQTAQEVVEAIESATSTPLPPADTEEAPNEEQSGPQA